MLFVFLLSLYNNEFKGPLSTTVILKSGQYRVFCHGAQGGRAYRNGNLQSYGGKGAYTTGVMQITGSGTTFYLNVGGMGGHETSLGPNSGGFNGGGKSGKDIADESGYEDAKGGGDDASGGGGGATDIRIHNNNLGNRIMVAGGGSGALSHCDGSPGGDYKGYYPADSSCNTYIQSDEVTETKGNANGVGSNGKDHSCSPGSGGGGGYRGGLRRDHDTCKASLNHLAVAFSGTSYISGHPNFKVNSLMVFNETIMHYGNYADFGNSGNGRLKIEAVYECPSDCSDCSSGTLCISCLSYAYKYDDLCYVKCDVLSNPSENKFFGNDVENKVCHECSVINCMNCSNNYKVCDNCINGFHLENNECVHDPTDEFTYSKYFSKSVVFTSSDKFLPSFDFSPSLQFTKSSEFTFSSGFSHSKDYTKSNAFSSSIKFSKSLKFTPSIKFSQTSEFTCSSYFSNSKSFTSSSDFSSSLSFSISSNFMPTLTFKPSSGFSSSSSFSISSIFTDSKDFTFSLIFSNSESLIKNIFGESNVFELPPEKKKKSYGPIIGIIFGVLAAIAVLILIILIYKKKKKDKGTNEESPNQNQTNRSSIENDSPKDDSYIYNRVEYDPDIDFWL